MSEYRWESFDSDDLEQWSKDPVTASFFTRIGIDAGIIEREILNRIKTGNPDPIGLARLGGQLSAIDAISSHVGSFRVR